MIPGETNETIMEELKRIIAPIVEGESRLQVETKVRPSHFDPYLISEDQPIVQTAIKSFEQVTGQRPEIAGKAACTDASSLFHKAGIPTVLFGPGNESLCHRPDECVAIENIVLSTEIFISIFDKLLSK